RLSLGPDEPRLQVSRIADVAAGRRHERPARLLDRGESEHVLEGVVFDRLHALAARETIDVKEVRAQRRKELRLGCRTEGQSGHGRRPTPSRVTHRLSLLARLPRRWRAPAAEQGKRAVAEKPDTGPRLTFRFGLDNSLLHL